MATILSKLHFWNNTPITQFVQGPMILIKIVQTKILFKLASKQGTKHEFHFNQLLHNV